LLTEILLNIEQSCRSAGREPDSVQLLAVSKKQPIEKMLDYQQECLALDYPCVFGENYVQEYRDKIRERPILAGAHLIGPLQSNKVRAAVSLFECIQSVHSMKLLEQLAIEVDKQERPVSIYLQVDISDDERKHGFKPVQIEESLNFLARAENSNLKLKGLMTITRLYPEPEDVRPDFVRLREIRDQLNPALGLSMGMSADYSIAVEEGTTCVRIGSALFGERLAG